MENTFKGSKNYVASPELMNAVNIAVALKKPLLIKGEPGTGDGVQAVRHMRKIQKQIRDVVALRDDERFEAAKQLQVPVELVREVHATGKLPVVNFAAGGVATPADAALMMQLGAEGVFVGSGIFKSGDPAKRAAAKEYLQIVEWAAADVNPDPQQLGLAGSPTKVKKIENVVFQAKEAKKLTAADNDINELMVELIASHTLG